MVDVLIDKSWESVLHDEFAQPYFAQLVAFLHQRKREGAVIYPAGGDIFRAFSLTPRDEVRVVVVGQDPYHGAGQAHGLAFSVMDGTRHPPSLQNIFKELVDDQGVAYPLSGDLSHRAQQGVLLLNTTLTVEAGQPLSHRGTGWEIFTDAVIRRISDQKEGIIFLLRGGHAQKKQSLIDTARHYILRAPHPSPLSAYRGWFGSGHFSQVNALLSDMEKETIEWALS